MIGLERRHARQPALPIWVDRTAVAVVTGLSLFLGFFHLDERSLWLDEGYTWLASDQKLGVIFSIARQQGWHLVPYYLIVHATIALFGDSASALRAPSVVVGAACVPFVYLLGVRLTSRLATILACVLFAVSESLVLWQQNARDYTLVVFFAVASTFFAVVGVRRRQVWPFLLWAFLLGLGCYTHPEVLFLVPVHLAVFLLWSRSARVRVTLLALTGAGALAALPVLGEASHSNVYQITFLNPPNNNSATSIASFLASAASDAGPVTAVNHALLGITFVIVVIGVAMLGSDLAVNGCTPANFGPALFLAWAVAPVVMDWIVSETGRQAFTDRYVILSLPAVALLVGHVLMSIRPRALGLFLGAYLTIFHAGLLIDSYHYQLDDYRGATAYVLAQSRPGDCITFMSNEGRGLYDYYVTAMTSGSGSRRAPVQVLPFAVDGSPSIVLHYDELTDAYVSELQQLPYLKQIAPYCRQIFVFTSHTGGATGAPAETAKYSYLQHLKAELLDYYRPVATGSYTGVVVLVYDQVRPGR